MAGARVHQIEAQAIADHMQSNRPATPNLDALGNLSTINLLDASLLPKASLCKSSGKLSGINSR